MQSHFHPTVKHFVASLLKRTKIAYPGDPLEDFQVLILIYWVFRQAFSTGKAANKVAEAVTITTHTGHVSPLKERV